MSKRPLPMEWVVAKNDEDWAHLCTQSMLGGTQVGQYHPFSGRFLAPVSAMLLLLAITGGWVWHGNQARVKQIKAELTTTIQDELRAATQRHDPLAGNPAAGQAAMGRQDQSVPPGSTLETTHLTNVTGARFNGALRQTVQIEGDWVVADVVITVNPGAQQYRQTRFYENTGHGWLRVAPNAALWGPAHRLETAFFIFHYRQRDAQVVATAAPLLDELYTTLCRNFGLATPSATEKLVINVSVTQPPGAVDIQPATVGQFTVPSPAVYLAPVELTDSELLVQSIALLLIDQLIAEAIDHHAIPALWQPLLDALRLWQVWDLDLPLALWREDIVKWIYVDLPATNAPPLITLPDRYAELCAMHGLWMQHPMQLQIPLFCNKLDESSWFFVSWHIHQPLTHLVNFSPPAHANEYAEVLGKQGWVNYPGTTVVMTTLIEYVVTAYGREHLPALVAGLGHSQRWDTLVPAIFGVSSAEFEAGWQASLAAHK